MLRVNQERNIAAVSKCFEAAWNDLKSAPLGEQLSGFFEDFAEMQALKFSSASSPQKYL